MNAAPAFNAWLDDFFEAYYRHNPVGATFVGIHTHDHRLPDVSEEGWEARRSETASLLARLRALPTEPLTAAQRIDRTLAEGYLAVSTWEQDSPHFRRGNASTYTGEAVFGLLSLFLRPFAPAQERAAAAIARMDGLARYFQAARSQLQAAPVPWTERALRECAGARAFLTEGIELLCRDSILPGGALRSAVARAAQAFGAFEEWLGASLLTRTSENYACGEEVLDLLMRRAHCVEMGADELEREAADDIDRLSAYLDEHARDFGARSSAEALAQLEGIHPTSERYYATYTEIWNACRQAAEDHALLTWPDFPLEYVPQPHWARAAAPSLYFLFYRSPAPFDGVLPVQYLVTPIEPSMSAEKQEALLRATNTSVIKLNHVVHHGALGHHVQNWHAYRAESRVGQMAATDCASRIAMLCGGSMAEGWACYATDLMDEVGFLTPLEQYAEQLSRLRMAARTVADIRLHSGRWTIEDTAAFYRDTVGMSPQAARGEAVKNSMFPGTALMYRMGSNQIHRLRELRQRREGATFSLKAFHDRFLSWGSIPVSLIARAMEEDGQHAE